MDMKIGDLLHIPQAVLLWSVDSTHQLTMPYTQTNKPITAIYMGAVVTLDRDDLIAVFVNGREHYVHSRDVYLFKENQC
jgi:hypothetical protein